MLALPRLLSTPCCSALHRAVSERPRPPRLQVDDATAASAISQTGYKQSTWWEDDADGRDLSADWRS